MSQYKVILAYLRNISGGGLLLVVMNSFLQYRERQMKKVFVMSQGAVFCFVLVIGVVGTKALRKATWQSIILI